MRKLPKGMIAKIKMLENITPDQLAGVLWAKFEQQTGASPYVTDGEIELPACIPRKVVEAAVRKLQLENAKSTSTNAVPTMDAADEHLEVVACAPRTATEVFLNMHLFCDENIAYFDYLFNLLKNKKLYLRTMANVLANIRSTPRGILTVFVWRLLTANPPTNSSKNVSVHMHMIQTYCCSFMPYFMNEMCAYRPASIILTQETMKVP